MNLSSPQPSNKTMPTIAAKPTVYRGMLFRSRLEATWAAFFDGLKWRWEYEPHEMDGWLPDFAIYIGGQVVYVEIKPFFEVTQDYTHLVKVERNANCGSIIVACGLGGSAYRLRTHGHLFFWTQLSYAKETSGAFTFFQQPCMASRLLTGRCIGSNTDCLDHILSEGEVADFWARAKAATRYEPGRR